MKHYGFFDGNGNEITRGWQGWEYQARKLAQALADSRGITVEACEEPCVYNHEDDEPCEPVCVCEPQEDDTADEYEREVSR